MATQEVVEAQGSFDRNVKGFGDVLRLRGVRGLWGVKRIRVLNMFGGLNAFRNLMRDWGVKRFRRVMKFRGVSLVLQRVVHTSLNTNNNIHASDGK